MERNDVLSNVHSVDTGSFLDKESATTFLMPDKWLAERNQFFFILRLMNCIMTMLR